MGAVEEKEQVILVDSKEVELFKREYRIQIT
jgi:hypothetical protein